MVTEPATRSLSHMGPRGFHIAGTSNGAAKTVEVERLQGKTIRLQRVPAEM